VDHEKPLREILRHLFAAYLKGPSAIYPINKITKRYKIDPVEATDVLLALQWIRERWVYAGNVVACRITIRGIEEIDPVYVRTKLSQLIGGLAKSGGSRELIDILENKLSEYSIALDLVRQLEAMGLVRLRHPKDTIVIELTEKGKTFYKTGDGKLFSLMALA
jgi:hypothetical protein